MSVRAMWSSLHRILATFRATATVKIFQVDTGQLTAVWISAIKGNAPVGIDLYAVSAGVAA